MSKKVSKQEFVTVDKKLQGRWYTTWRSLKMLTLAKAGISGNQLLANPKKEPETDSYRDNYRAVYCCEQVSNSLLDFLALGKKCNLVYLTNN